MLFSICYIRSLQSGSKVSRFRRLAQRSKGAQQPKTQSLKDRLRCIIDAWLHTSVILCVCLCVKLDLLDFDTWAFLRTCHGSIPMISMMNPRKRMRWLHLTRCLSWAPCKLQQSGYPSMQRWPAAEEHQTANGRLGCFANPGQTTWKPCEVFGWGVKESNGWGQRDFRERICTSARTTPWPCDLAACAFVALVSVFLNFHCPQSICIMFDLLHTNAGYISMCDMFTPFFSSWGTESHGGPGCFATKAFPSKCPIQELHRRCRWWGTWHAQWEAHQEIAQEEEECQKTSSCSDQACSQGS